MLYPEQKIHRIKLLPKQQEFVDQTKARFKMYSGSRAAGKTYGICVDTYMKAIWPRSRVGLYRMNHIDLVNTTLVTLLEGDGMMGPIIPPGTYKHNQQKHRIDLYGGGTIVYGGFDKGIAAKEFGGTGGKSSLNLTAANIDEAVEVPEALVQQLDGGVRVPHPNVPMQIGLACNPGPPNHYLARRFGLSLDHKLLPEHYAIRTNLYDNFMLDERFLRTFPKSLSGVALMRYVWGLWVGSDGVIYSAFSRDVHTVERDEEVRRSVYGVDPGTNDPYAIYRGDVLSDNQIHISSEYYQTGKSPSEQVEILLSIVGDTGDVCVVDSAYPGLIKDMRKVGINAIACVKGPDSIMRGIGVVDRRLRGRVNGVPMLTISATCPKAISEFETYEYDHNAAGLKDKPKDDNNHAMDAIRYLVEHVDGAGGTYMSEPITSEAGDGEDIDYDVMYDDLVSFDEARKSDPNFGMGSSGWQ